MQGAAGGSSRPTSDFSMGDPFFISVNFLTYSGSLIFALLLPPASESSSSAGALLAPLPLQSTSSGLFGKDIASPFLLRNLNSYFPAADTQLTVISSGLKSHFSYALNITQVGAPILLKCILFISAEAPNGYSDNNYKVVWPSPLENPIASGTIAYFLMFLGDFTATSNSSLSYRSMFITLLFLSSMPSQSNFHSEAP